MPQAITYATRTPDAALLKRIRRGDMDAFATLYDGCAPLLYGIIRKIVADDNRAEDTLRNVFLDIRNELRSGSVEIPSGINWMLQLARKHALARKENETVKPVTHSPVAVFDLIYFNGLSVQAVAEKLHLSEKEVRESVQQAFRNFRNSTSSK
jgi:DNA-directed RNA polymerase specialized sigma24 family protein